MDETAEALDNYFPKGDKRRGEAMLVAGIAKIEGRAEMKQIILNKIGEKNGDSKISEEV